MALLKPITIVGGGLAGLTLGIGLRKHGVPVRVWEAAHYPRHRVCGEFISGEGLETLARLDLRQLLLRAGAVEAHTAAFFSRRTASRPQALPTRALCVSRFVLDAALAEEFRRLGGELRAGERWRETFLSEGVVRATGRHAQPTENGWRWFGLKAHARGIALAADLEMHVSSKGYVGLCRLAGGEVNVCGLFRRRAATEQRSRNQSGTALPAGQSKVESTLVSSWGSSLSPDRLEALSHVPAGHVREPLWGEPGSLLHERLAGAVFDETSFCSVAGLALKPQRASAHGECRIGDAITMTPPVTGNGMSMAFESAEIALAPLVAWSGGQISWTRAQQTIAGECDTAFQGRLAWAEKLQSLTLTPAIQGPLVWLVARSGWFWRAWFERTR